ncbi:hypothetical protein [Microbacterium sp. ZW T5_56]|uniref:hypothetical protein n=1 Tax=Microbacterium sp. ZW T5_56 TaxID=3378081 RepID=UPI0038524ABA
MRRSITLSMLAATVVLAATGLVGCTGGAASANQSVEDACKVVQTEMTSFQTEMAGLAGELSSGDTDAAKKAFSAVTTKLDDIAGKVGNAEVKDAVTGMSKAFGTVVEGISGSTPDPSLLTELSDSASKLQTLCPGLN